MHSATDGRFVLECPPHVNDTSLAAMYANIEKTMVILLTAQLASAARRRDMGMDS